MPDTLTRDYMPPLDLEEIRQRNEDRKRQLEWHSNDGDVEAMLRELEALRAAARPFAEYARAFARYARDIPDTARMNEEWPGDEESLVPTVGDCRRLAALLPASSIYVAPMRVLEPPERIGETADEPEGQAAQARSAAP